MAIRFRVRKADGTIWIPIFPSERVFVEGIQSLAGVPVDGNWGRGTTAALLAMPVVSANPSLRPAIESVTTTGIISQEAARDAFKIAYSQNITTDPRIGPGAIIGDMVEGFTPFPYGRVAPGARGSISLEPAPVAPRPDPAPPGPGPSPDTTPPPPSPDGNFDPIDITPNTILGLSKPVAIGLGVGIGVFLLGGLALAASRKS